MVVGAAASGISAWRRAAAAAEVAEGRVRGSIPETRPESPMKDKPTARRPPAESGIDVPTPRVEREAQTKLSPSKAYGELREALAPLHGTARALAAGCDARRARISSRCSSGLQQRSRHTAAPKLWIDQKLCCKRQCRLRRHCHEKRTKEGERRRRLQTRSRR